MVDAEESFQNLGSIVRLTSSIPARARFVYEVMLTCNMSSLAMGLLCGKVGAQFLSCGPLVPYMVGSWTGFTLGLYSVWKSSSQLACDYARRYPTLLAHVMTYEFGLPVPPRHVQKPSRFEDWIKEGGFARMSFAILSAQSCQSDVNEAIKNGRQEVLEAAIEKHAAENAKKSRRGEKTSSSRPKISKSSIPETESEADVETE